MKFLRSGWLDFLFIVWLPVSHHPYLLLFLHIMKLLSCGKYKIAAFIYYINIKYERLHLKVKVKPNLHFTHESSLKLIHSWTIFLLLTEKSNLFYSVVLSTKLVHWIQATKELWSKMQKLGFEIMKNNNNAKVLIKIKLAPSFVYLTFSMFNV